jgi:hypothetical protein
MLAVHNVKQRATWRMRRDAVHLFFFLSFPDVGSHVSHFARIKPYDTALSPNCPATFPIWAPIISCPYHKLEPRYCNDQSERRVTAAVVLLTNQNYKYNSYTRNLVGRSIGRCLRNRLLTGNSMRFTIRSFGCALRRALYWELYGRISSLTVGVSASSNGG